MDNGKRDRDGERKKVYRMKDESGEDESRPLREKINMKCTTIYKCSPQIMQLPYYTKQTNKRTNKSKIYTKNKTKKDNNNHNNNNHIYYYKRRGKGVER